MHRYRAIIVSDDRDWGDSAAEACLESGAVTECRTWADAAAVRDPPAVLLLDIHPRVDELTTVERWAANVWYPLCIISLRPTPGITETQERLVALGYRRFLYTSNRDSYFDQLISAVQQVIAQRSWLVPRAVRAVGCADTAVVEALSLAVIIAPEATTVERWAKEYGLKSARGLEALFRRCRISNPAAVYQWLRLARVVDFAERASRRPSRDELAKMFGYASGDYLGRRAKALTGQALGSVLSLSLDRFFELMAKRLKPSLQPDS